MRAGQFSDSSSEDDEATSRRGDIKRTAFGANSSTDTGRKPTYGIRKSSRTAPTKPQSPKRPRDSEDEIEEPVKRTKAVGRKDDDFGSQFKTDALQRRAVGSKASYGTQKKGGYCKSAKAVSKSLSVPKNISSPEKPKREFKPVDLSDDFSSPEKAKGKLVLPDAEDFLLTPSPKKTYKARSEAHGDLETPSPVKLFKLPRDIDEALLDSSPEKPKAKTAQSKNSSDSLMQRARLLRQQKKAEKEAKLRRQKEMEDATPKAVFKMPPGLGSQDDLAYDSDLDILNDSPTVELTPVYDILPAIDDHDEPVCPMCGEAVQQELLDKFSKKKTMGITQQHRFCNYHKAKTARQTWVDRGYPDINWSKLDERIARHHRFLEDILKGGDSHFGTLFGTNVKTGKNKTLLKSDQNLTPGYYGSRGARVMTENLIDRFSSLLRKVAVQDRLVSARGHTAFVQFVLVPELAVRLIMEDMDVPAEKARIIMEESQKVGDLLNEEEDDVIVEDEEDRSSSGSMSSLSSLEDDDLSVGLS
ncbi:hypothetical protein CONLIGDRAFT_17505 [Coniochaeta ligniaria NRRL 30616]|uniref:Restriction of telomere capping protein 4 n=1 Tax=Coniochaeta ligniaria NRRL 30616 TaxID=1408157 RepID=A0A1J7JMT6_9PEZI|nr:hypothetical protein CONLIGDRAFT_17505 [Coniochaeta ligniaria NRRL 30616]